MQPALTGPALPTSRRRVPLWWWPAALFALAIAAYSLRYVAVGERAYVPEVSESFRARPLTVTVHTLFGPVALVLGLVNLLPAMRQRRRWAAHRIVGRIYMVSALALGGAGFSLAFHAAGGYLARVGFCLLAAMTLGTVAQAYRYIRSGDVKGHREWVLRNYALIFGAVTLRIWLPILIIAHQGEFLPAYRWVAWLSWVPNILWAEWIIRRGWKPSYVLADGSASARLVAGQ
jgi:uncharacterized membrane protein